MFILNVHPNVHLNDYTNARDTLDWDVHVNVYMDVIMIFI